MLSKEKSSSVAACLAAACLLALSSPLSAQSGFTLGSAQDFLKAYCVACHQADNATAHFRVDQLGSIESFRSQPNEWTRLVSRIANSEMPPQGAPAPGLDEREAFLDWAAATWREQACAADVEPSPNLIRRLNRDEYSATIRDLFDLQLDVSRSLPVDGPGGEGFDNAAETLFLSPLHSEKYIEIAKFVVDAASKEFKSRSLIFIAKPTDGLSEKAAAERILKAFLPRAFRRPVDNDTVKTYVALFRAARKQGQDFEPAIFFALRSVLVSPLFLFQLDPAENDRALEQYALASRLSYFLWGSMPDELLTDIAAAGQMDNPAVLRRLVGRMLRDDRSLEFSTRFIEQWLRTRELEEGGPDPELFPDYVEKEDLRPDTRLQPVFFFQQVFRENLSLLNFLDSTSTILTRALADHFGLEFEPKLSKNPEWIELPAGSNRGGLLSMPAVLAISSHPYRTSPVLRGAWILDSILGAPPPPPPPDVPALEDQQTPEKPKSMRELLTLHRANAVCASCHNRIDPLGFALDNYDVLGAWRDDDAGQRIHAGGKLTDGTEIDGPAGLKQALIERDELFIRNLTKRMLGYALGRGLTPADACAVETIVERVRANNHQAWTLLEEIVISEPFLRAARAAKIPPKPTAELRR